jgi:exonuclease SbcC
LLIQRLYLRNFRVYEEELDLELPPGLVGIYGPNGSGKSTLLEAILFTLWGKARTTKEHIRSAGVGGDCVTEVEFEHEGHLYLVRRKLKGINSAVTVEAHCDGLLVSTGTREAEHYVESVLGMDDAAFRASVFTEQKQLAAFSNQSPAERRRLVLQLLGITPLDGARDAARKDARQLTGDHDRLRGMLPDLAAIEVDVGDAEARAESTEKTAEDEQRAAAVAEAKLTSAVEAFSALDRQRQEHESLMIEGRSARQELDGLREQAEKQRGELDQLEAISGGLEGLESAARGLDEAERNLPLLAAAATAAAAAERVVVPKEPAPANEDGVDQARRATADARETLAGLSALVAATADGVARAREAATRSASLSGEADCPMCGQALGASFETVQAHRAQEVADAELRAQDLQSQHAVAEAAAKQAEARLSEIESAADKARRLRTAWEQADRQRRDAFQALAAAWEAVVSVVSHPDTPDGSVLPANALAQEVVELQADIAARRAAGSEAARIKGRLEQRPALQQALAVGAERVAASEAKVQTLRDKVHALGFDQKALDRAVQVRDGAASVSRSAAAAATQAGLEAARERERANGAAERLAAARLQHAKLADVEKEARHVARVADLLSEFRNTVVASVGPRLAAQAAELFGELTDHEYDQLEVNPDTYELQISDGGHLYGLDRFSGSEIDLANLALRVAISEHIHFQSGGSVGLLVLDEVFGPLDEDRKARMLLALERLRGRFRQVLVVTHDIEIKEQLPNAIEVVKLPGRRATARNVAD